VLVSVPSESNGRPSNPQEVAGLLSSLPRTRPQRSTPRRTAARDAVTSATASDPPSAKAPATPRSRPAKRVKASTSTKAVSSPKTPSAGKASTGKGPTKARKRPAPKRPTATPAGESVPPQGFEAESDHAHGAVHPPSGTEMVGAATEILGELAKAGISAGERLFKDVLSRLPLS
jgi:hypothetical protein